MAFKDKCNKKVTAGDIVESNDNLYRIKVIEEYVMATTVIAENIITHQIETLLLRDVKKI